MVNILIGCTGSAATIQLPKLINDLHLQIYVPIKIKIIATNRAFHFFKRDDLPMDIPVFTDDDEWATWSRRGDPIIHIDLGNWADILLIAPMDANTLAKISNGICDNLLTCTVRAWEMRKPLFFCPAMNTRMYEHPLTIQQIDILESWGYKLIPAIEKTLMCGETGVGAMAEVATIVGRLNNLLVPLNKAFK